MKDYYAILGVSKTASQDEIKKAFRKLAHEHHPDKGGDAAKFKEANEAYGVLGDEAKRKQYDTYGSAGPRGGAGGPGAGFGGFDFSGFQQGNGFGGVEFDMGDIFSSFFGGGGRERRGKNIEVLAELSFKEAIFGSKQVIELYAPSKCTTCEGTGCSKGTARVMCKECAGKGKKASVKQTMLGAIRTTETCSVCHGAGTVPEKPCADCKGAGVTKRKIRHEVDVPAGADNGDRYVVRGAGEAIEGGPSGDLIIVVRVKKDKKFERDGVDIVTELEIPLSASLMGEKIEFDSVDGPITIEVPPLSRHGEEVVVRGKGVPHGRSRGDLRVSLSVAMPRKPSKVMKDLAEALKKEGN
jgi:molecular chaperone DnaJ